MPGAEDGSLSPAVLAPGKTESTNAETLSVVAGGAALGAFGKVLRYAANYFYLVLLARLLPVASLDGYLVALAMVMLSTQICQLGLDRGVVKYVALYDSKNDAESLKGTIVLTLVTGLTIGLLGAGVGSFSLPLLARQGGALAQAMPLLGLMVWSLPALVIGQLALAASRGFKIMRHTTISEDLVLPLTNFGLFVAFFAYLQSARAAALAHVAAASLAAGTALLLLVRATPALRPAVRGEYTVLGRLFGTSLPLIVPAIAAYSYTWSGVFILGFTGREGDVTIYQLALRTTFVLVLFTMPLNQMSAPVMSSLYGSRDTQELQRFLRTVTRWIVTGGAPAIVGISLFAGDWLAIFGEGYRSGAAALAILVGGTFLMTISGPAYWLLQMTGRQAALAVMMTGFVCSKVLLIWWLSMLWGALGAALGMLLAVCPYVFGLHWWIHKQLGVHPFSARLARPLAAVLVATAAAWLLKSALADLQGGWMYLRLGGGFAVVLLVYSLMLAALGFEQEDRELLGQARRRLVAMVRGGQRS